MIGNLRMTSPKTQESTKKMGHHQLVSPRSTVAVVCHIFIRSEMCPGHSYLAVLGKVTGLGSIGLPGGPDLCPSLSAVWQWTARGCVSSYIKLYQLRPGV